MASLLRGQPVLCRILAAVGRSQVKQTRCISRIAQLNNQRPTPIKEIIRNYASGYQQQGPPRSFGMDRMQRTQAMSVPRNVDDALNMIDREVRRVGRVRKNAVMTTYSAVQESGSVTNHQSLLLLRCFGSVMVDENPAERVKLAESLWTGLQDLGAKYDVTHYNALIQVYLHNGHPFSPAEYLSKIESAGLKPNRVTYQRLIAGYCQTGDMQGASQVLEHMKTSNIPINETVFNSLITGHTRAGDMESATGILKIMSESGIPPSADTYSTLMTEYARKGDIESIEKTSRQADEAEVMFFPSNYFTVLQALCSNGYNQHVDKVLSLVPRDHKFGYNQDCMNAVLQMVARGHDEIAHKLFLSMQHPTLLNQTDPTFGRFLIKEMIKHERPIETVVATMRDMKSRELSTDGVDFIAQWALVYEKTNYALEAFDLLVKEGLPLRTHYFWPLIIALRKQKNTEGIYNAVKMMEEKVKESHDFIYTLHEQIIPSLIEMGEEFSTIKDKLMQMGILEGDINFASMIHLMRSGKNEEAVNLAKEKEIRFHQNPLLQYIFAWFKATKDVDSVVEVLSLAQNRPAITTRSTRVTDAATKFLYSYMDMHRTDASRMESLVRSMVEKQLGITDSEGLPSKLKAVGVPAELVEQLMSTKVADDQFRQDNRRFQSGEQTAYGSKSIDELEKILVQNRANETNIKGPLRWLLEKHCQAGNVSRVDEIKTELDGLGFIYTPDLIRSLIHLSAWFKKDLAEASKYMEMLESQYSNFRAYITEVINLAALHAREGNITAALDLIKAYHAKYESYIKDKTLGDSYMNEPQCLHLIQCAQEAGQMEAPREIISTLFDLEFIRRGCFKLLQAYVDGYLQKGDVNGAIEALAYCHKEYRRVPLFENVFRILIQNEDPEKLQQVMDMASANLGEMQALHHLVFCCVECGKEAQAKRILETPGMRAMNDLLESFGNQLIGRKKVKELESLGNVTRGLFGLDRELMLFLLMKGYCLEDEMDKALNVLTIMEEENINPRGRTLRYMGNALKTKNMEVPFSIPEIPTPLPRDEPMERTNEASRQSMSALTPQEREVVKQAAVGNVTSVKEIKESLGGSLKTQFVIEMTHALLRSKRKGSLKFFVNELAAMGDAQSLEEMRKLNLRILNMGMIHLGIAKAYLEIGAPEKVLNLLRTDPKNYSKYLSAAVCQSFHDKYPSMFKQFEDLTLEAGESGNLQAVTFLWQHYILTEQLEKCSKLNERFPGLNDELRIAEPCVRFKNNNREDLLQFIVDSSKGSNSNRLFAYSYLLGLKCEQNDSQGALNVLGKVKEEGFTTDDLRPFPLALLESLLIAQNQSVPWPVGKYGQVPAALRAQSSDSSSDSSSSSDSDTEASKPAETVA